MENELTDIFSTAKDDLEKKWQEYMKQSSVKLQSKFNALQTAVASHDAVTIANATADYQSAVQLQLLRSKHYQLMVDTTASKLSNVNQIAQDYTNEQMASIYTFGYNALPGDTPVKGYSFELVDEYTVKELAAHNGSLLPHKQVDKYKDVAWNKKSINSQVLQGILQGESIPDIAKRLQNVTDMNKSAAIRNARTMTTCAENKGRQASYNRASQDGVKLKKIWLSAGNDGRTRDSHLQAGIDYIDGIPVTMKFHVGSDDLVYPGDPAGSPSEVYNCRCTMYTKVVGFKPSKDIVENQSIDDALMSSETEKSTTDDSILGETATQFQDTTDAQLLAYESAQNYAKDIKQQLDDLGSQTVEGIWNNPLSVESAVSMKGFKKSCEMKYDYYTTKIASLEAKGSLEDWELIKLEQLKANEQKLTDFEKQVKQYKKLQKSYDKALTDAKALKPKSEIGGSFSSDVYAHKELALAFTDGETADKYHRAQLDATWDTLEDKEKYSIWEYTRNSNPMNKSLSGYHDDWSRSDFIGMDKTEWSHEDRWRTLSGYSDFDKFAKDRHVQYKNVVTDLTNAIEKSTLQDSVMLVRGSDKSGLAGLIEGDIFTFDEAEALLRGNIDDIKSALEGQVFYNHAFTSTGIATGTGFGGNVKYKIFAPEGTHAIYAEPQSYYGDTADNRLYKKGEQYLSVGHEAEVIIQRGTGYRITNVAKEDSYIEVEMEIVDQPDYFKFGDEDTYNKGATRHQK